MLFFGDNGSPALAAFENGLQNKLEKELHAPVWIYTEWFEWVGQDPEHVRAMETYLRHKYDNRGINLIVAGGDYPLQFIKTRRNLVPGAKLVYVTWAPPQQSTEDVTGLIYKLDLTPTLDIALAQNPGTRHVMLITGATETDRAFVQLLVPSAAKHLKEKHNNDVDIQLLPSGTLDEAFAYVARFPPDAVAMFLSYYGDSTGTNFIPARVLPAFSAHSNRPIYSWGDVALGRGIVGGSLTNFEANGAALGKLAAQVLRSSSPDSIPPIGSVPPQNMFDWKQMKRWGVSIETLPPGSTVINREFTAWELYKWRIIAVVMLIALQAGLILILIRLVSAEHQHVRQLAYKERREALIASCAASFIKLPAALVNAEIEKSFQRLLEVFNLDRINLFEYRAGTAQLHLLCSRSSEEFGAVPTTIELRELPWAATKMLRSKPFMASRIEELPKEASALAERLRTAGIKSFITFPLQHEGSTFATLGFSTLRNERTWDPDLVQALQTVANIFSSALQQKYAEESLSEARNHLNMIVESAMDAIIVVDAQQHIVVFNSAAEKMFGCSRDDLLGTLPERFIPLRLRDLHSDRFFDFSHSDAIEPLTGTIRVMQALRANGEEFPIEASISRVDVDNGNDLFIAIIRDVTEREQSHRKLQESHDLNHSILLSLRNEVAVLDGEGNVVAATEGGPNRLRHPENCLVNLRVGENFFERCRSALETGDSTVRTVVSAVRAIYHGKKRYFELEHRSGSATDQHWYLMSVTPLHSNSKGVVISHQDITERKRHEEAIQDLSGRLIGAQERERSRIARELHDDINQQVAMLAIEIQGLLRLLPDESSSQAKKKINALWEKTYALSTDIQDLSHQLHSTKLEHLGITAALRGLCEEFSAQHNIEAHFEFRQVPAAVDSEIALSLFRVAQESLHNVAKHSHAKQVRVELIRADSGLLLRISDDGVGFDMNVRQSNTGLGLISMNERMRLVGGTFLLTSRKSLGTQVEAVIPMCQRNIAAEAAS